MAPPWRTGVVAPEGQLPEPSNQLLLGVDSVEDRADVVLIVLSSALSRVPVTLAPVPLSLVTLRGETEGEEPLFDRSRGWSVLEAGLEVKTGSSEAVL